MAGNCSFSSPEATLLLVSTKNRDLWPSPTPEVRDSWTTRHSAHVQSQVRTNLIGSGLDLLCLQSHSKTECHWRKPEVAILGADQKERGFWGREWKLLRIMAACRCFSLLGYFIGTKQNTKQSTSKDKEPSTTTGCEDSEPKAKKAKRNVCSWR